MSTIDLVDQGYSLENARKFKWSSVSGDLNPERVAHLEKYLVGRQILDAGCGGGAFVNFLSTRGFDVTGVDKFGMFLDVAGEQKFKGTFIQADLMSLPFPDKSFDTTYCFDVMEHIDDLRAIRELARVTRKRILIAVPREDDLLSSFGMTFMHYQDKTHLRNYTEDSLRRLGQSVKPAAVNVFPELPIGANHLFAELLIPVGAHTDANGRPITPSPLARLKNMIRKRSMRNLQFKQVYSGLVAVIDLEHQ